MRFRRRCNQRILSILSQGFAEVPECQKTKIIVNIVNTDLAIMPKVIKIACVTKKSDRTLALSLTDRRLKHLDRPQFEGQ
jgi:hypothetical protein